MADSNILSYYTQQMSPQPPKCYINIISSGNIELQIDQIHHILNFQGFLIQAKPNPSSNRTKDHAQHLTLLLISCYQPLLFMSNNSSRLQQSSEQKQFKMSCKETMSLLRHIIFGVLLASINFISSLINIYYLFREDHVLFGFLDLSLLWIPGRYNCHS